MGELGFPELTTEQIELLSQTVEDAARKYVLSKVSSKDVDRLDIIVETEGTKPVSVTVEVNLVLSSKNENANAETLVKTAVIEGQKAAEKFLRKIK